MDLSEESPVEALLASIARCRLCAEQGYPIAVGPIACHNERRPDGTAEFVVIGQAPSLTDVRVGRTYRGPAGQRLVSWLRDAGFTDEEIGSRVWMTALTKCFPGRLPGKSTDRAPSPAERANCRPWLEREIALLSPRVLILFGKMAIDTFLSPAGPLDERIGRAFDVGGRIAIPLPHSSGASTWLNSLENQALLAKAIALIRSARDGN